jgi:putative transposase
MSNYRRNRVSGGTFFFTVNLLDRNSNLLVANIELLRRVVRQVIQRQPFQIEAWVVLPEHMHCVWTLPEHDSDYVTRWKEIKMQFSKALPKTEALSEARTAQGERGIWQRRYWEHTIHNDNDFAAHVDYCHINPFKHGLVEHVKDWPYSTFHRAVKRGIYPENWASDIPEIEAGEAQ